MERAVIFYDRVRFDAGRDGCFGIAYDATPLPPNSVVVGFLVVDEDTGVLNKALYPLAGSAGFEEAFRIAVADALEHLMP